MAFDVRVAIDEPALLGEGPVWHAAELALWYCDIYGHRLHRFLPSTGESAQMLHTPSAQSTTTATSTGKLVAIASCCHVRENDRPERLLRSKPKIWLVNDIGKT